MTTFSKVLDVIFLVSLILTVLGLIVYYIIEIFSSFGMVTINLVEIGNVIWKIIYICLAGVVCSFVLKYIID